MLLEVKSLRFLESPLGEIGKHCRLKIYSRKSCRFVRQRVFGGVVEWLMAQTVNLLAFSTGSNPNFHKKVHSNNISTIFKS